MDLIRIVLKTEEGIAKVESFKTEKRTYGIEISLELALYYGFNARNALEQAQQKVGHAIEEFTSITIVGVNVRAGHLLHKGED